SGQAASFVAAKHLDADVLYGRGYLEVLGHALVAALLDGSSHPLEYRGLLGDCVVVDHRVTALCSSRAHRQRPGLRHHHLTQQKNRLAHASVSFLCSTSAP